MLECFSTDELYNSQSIPIYLVEADNFSGWLSAQAESTKKWIHLNQFLGKKNTFLLIPNSFGQIDSVIMVLSSLNDFFSVGLLPYSLPEGYYKLEISDQLLKDYVYSWGLGAYQFDRYKKKQRMPSILTISEELQKSIENEIEAIYLVRDLINLPAEDMGPSELSRFAEKLAKTYQASYTEIVGEDLIGTYNGIYAVGKSSDDEPRLIDIRWGNPNHPKVTLIGKGVCFDSGGLDIKPGPYMLLMKKDMAGAAHVLGLAKLIMHNKLALNLRVLIPACENVISSKAYRPGDVIKMRNGMTVEVGNTDAGGRIVLAEAITEAVSEKPSILIDIATLTGAARVAVGTDIAAVFSNTKKLVGEIIEFGEKENDPIWELPLYIPYREYLNSSIADINNNSNEPYAGASVAALFLKEFVPDHIPWLHFDIMAWNTRARPGKPVGGEAMTIKALFSYLSAFALSPKLYEASELND